ncbi:MAG: Nif3-like dinuclear metal center hexameric protein, partial [Bacteroidales bacterium]|nr:Nif3-like dinuclear metal center hexameric protein [Bacteroidales bacterium]
MKVSEIISAIEELAPISLKEEYDNPGLQVGDSSIEATGALLCVDVTEAVVDEAIECGVNLIISHHPILFKGLKSVTG